MKFLKHNKQKFFEWFQRLLGSERNFFWFLSESEFHDSTGIFQFFVKKIFSFSNLSTNSIWLLVQHLPVTNFSSPTHNLPLNLHDSLIPIHFTTCCDSLFSRFLQGLYRFKKSPNFLLDFSHKKKHRFHRCKIFQRTERTWEFLIFLHDPLCLVSREDLIVNGTTQLKR